MRQYMDIMIAHSSSRHQYSCLSAVFLPRLIEQRELRALNSLHTLQACPLRAVALQLSVGMDGIELDKLRASRAAPPCVADVAPTLVHLPVVSFRPTREATRSRPGRGWQQGHRKKVLTSWSPMCVLRGVTDRSLTLLTSNSTPRSVRYSQIRPYPAATFTRDTSTMVATLCCSKRRNSSSTPC